MRANAIHAVAFVALVWAAAALPVSERGVALEDAQTREENVNQALVATSAAATGLDTSLYDISGKLITPKPKVIFEHSEPAQQPAQAKQEAVQAAAPTQDMEKAQTESTPQQPQASSQQEPAKAVQTNPTSVTTLPVVAPVADTKASPTTASENAAPTTELPASASTQQSTTVATKAVDATPATTPTDAAPAATPTDAAPATATATATTSNQQRATSPAQNSGAIPAPATATAPTNESPNHAEQSPEEKIKSFFGMIPNNFAEQAPAETEEKESMVDKIGRGLPGLLELTPFRYTAKDPTLTEEDMTSSGWLGSSMHSATSSGIMAITKKWTTAEDTESFKKAKSEDFASSNPMYEAAEDTTLTRIKTVASSSLGTGSSGVASGQTSSN